MVIINGPKSESDSKKVQNLTFSGDFPIQLKVAIGLVPIVLGEPPVQYGAPAFSGAGLSGGYSVGGSVGYHNTNEGLDVDPHLLHKIQSILVDHEIQEDEHRQHSLSSVYLPSPAYGVPHYSSGHHGGRVYGIEFGGIRPAVQVAQFHQVSHQYNAGGHHHGHHYAPTHGYAIPSAPSHNYLPPSSYSQGYSGSSGISHGYSVPSAPAFLVAPRPQLAYGPPPSPRYSPNYHH